MSALWIIALGVFGLYCLFLVAVEISLWWQERQNVIRSPTDSEGK